MALRTAELFAGVGMLGEGLRAGLGHLGIETRTVVYVEREAYPASVLAARMQEGSLDEAPIWSDVTTFNAQQWAGAVDCVVAGFPCQDLSLAGRRAGLDGKRSGLFFEVVRIARDCGARYLFLENVAGIASATATVVDEAEGELDERAASRVLGELADCGWHAEWITLSASDVGASHGRARWFCWAWRTLDDARRVQRSERHEQDRPSSTKESRNQANDRTANRSHLLDHPRRQHQHLQQREDGAEHSGAGQQLADTSGTRPPEREWQRRICDETQFGDTRPSAELRGNPLFAPGPADPAWAGIIASQPWLRPALGIEEQHDAQAAFQAAQSNVCGKPDGLAARLDFNARAQRLKCCGNGVVALQAAAALVCIVRRMRETT